MYYKKLHLKLTQIIKTPLLNPHLLFILYNNNLIKKLHNYLCVCKVQIYDENLEI